MQVQVHQAILMEIHRRLLAKDRSALKDLVGVLLEPIVGELTRCFRRADEQVIRDAVNDALLDECANPERFDASHGVPLDRYLAAAARRNVRDWERGEHRRKQREQRYSCKKKEANVALDPAAANILQEVQEGQQRKIQCLERVCKWLILIVHAGRNRRSIR